jgi:cytochrome c5
MSRHQRVMVVSAVAVVALSHAIVWGRALQEGHNAVPDSSRTVWSGVYTSAQADRGAAVYARECANCHGVGLDGADMSPALAGAGFMANWNDLTLGDLFERIRISMPANRPGALSRQENTDVIAHLLRSNQFPEGKSELPTETPSLRTITFVTVQP